MKSIRQLIRRPGKMILGILLVMLACTLLCVSIGQYLAAIQMQSQIEREYTTIALPTNKFKKQSILDEEGNSIGVTYLPEQPREIRDFLSSLPEQYPEQIKTMESHGFISGYCPAMDPINYTQVGFQREGDALSLIETSPYTCAILAITVDEIGELTPFATENQAFSGEDLRRYGKVAQVDGTVQQVYALQEGYTDPTGRTIHLNIRVESEEAFQALELKVGETYLVYGTDYVDEDWNLRCFVSNGNRKVYDTFSWSNIRYLTEEEKETHRADNELNGITEDYVAVYGVEIDGTPTGMYLTEQQLLDIDSCSLTVCSNPGILQGALTENEIRIFHDEEEIKLPAEEYNKRYGQAGIVHLDESVEEFWNELKDPLWKSAQDMTQINNHAFPVVATGNLRSIAQFGTQDALVSTGRTFSPEEYRQGSAVCVISETLAAQNGLTVGDTIPLRYYEPDPMLPGQSFLKTANPSPCYYSQEQGFSSEERDYEIVGLYRQKEEWTGEAYAFTPNTIFVPRNSVEGDLQTSDSGIFCTLVLENGTMDELESKVAAAGYEGLLVCYDQGFSDISASLSEYFSVSNMVLLIGSISWAGLAAVFVFLFPGHQGREAQRMWTLGTPRSWIVRHIVTGSIGIILPGVLLGGLVTMGIMERVLRQIGTYAGLSVELSESFWQILVPVSIQLVILTAMVYLVGRALVRSLEKK